MDLKPNEIIIFPANAEDPETYPDWRGRCLVNGQEYRVALWSRTSKKGYDYMSGSLEPFTRGEKPAQAPPPPRETTGPARTRGINPAPRGQQAPPPPEPTDGEKDPTDDLPF